MDREQGITFPRITALIDLHDENQRLDMYSMGSAVALGFNDPKKLKTFLKSPKKESEVQATGMLAIPKKRHG